MSEHTTVQASVEPSGRQWWRIGGGALRCDVRKVLLWVLLIAGVLVTWGLWLLLEDIQTQFDKQRADDAARKAATTQTQPLE